MGLAHVVRLTHFAAFLQFFLAFTLFISHTSCHSCFSKVFKYFPFASLSELWRLGAMTCWWHGTSFTSTIEFSVHLMKVLAGLHLCPGPCQNLYHCFINEQLSKPLVVSSTRGFGCLATIAALWCLTFYLWIMQTFEATLGLDIVNTSGYCRCL